MLFGINISDLFDEKSRFPEVQTEYINAFLDSIWLEPNSHSASLLIKAISQLNQLKLSHRTRMHALELYRPSVFKIGQLLARHFSSSTLPFPQETSQSASLAESLFKELSYGYHLALLDKKNKLLTFNLVSEASIALALIRIFEVQRELAMVYHLTYFSINAQFWSNLNQLYFYASELGIESVEISIGDSLTISPKLIYTQILLLQTANTKNLHPVDIALCADYIVRNASSEMLFPAENQTVTEGFFISLKSNQPPLPISTIDKSCELPSVLYLNTSKLAAKVLLHIDCINKGNIPSDDSVPKYEVSDQFIDLLSYLVKQWGINRERTHPRREQSRDIAIGITLNAAHFFINDQEIYSHPESSNNSSADPDRVPNEQGKSPNYYPSTWKILNSSVAGASLKRPIQAKESIQIGDILCIQGAISNKWNVASIRWASYKEDHQIEIGTQIISESAIATGARRANQDNFENVLLMPGNDKLKVNPSIIGPCGMFEYGRLLEIDEMGKKTKIVMMYKLIQRTNSFEHFYYRYL